MSIRSKILVHWTGKGKKRSPDIEESPEAKKPRRYVERLAEWYKEGIRSMRTVEPTVKGRKIKHLVRLCFTEIRLSEAHTHAERYGRLGIGFSRDFIMEREGRPVIYISRLQEGLLERSIREVEEKLKVDDLCPKQPEEIEGQRASKWVMAHVKRMTDKKGRENYYEEMEWRVVYNETDSTYWKRGNKKGEHRFLFQPKDVKVIVFPDECTKQLALTDGELQKLLLKHMPSLMTLEDCRHF